MTGRESFNRFSKILDIAVRIFNVLGRGINYRMLRTFRHTNGKTGLALRYVFLKNCAASVGRNVSVQPGVYLLNCKNLHIGDNVSIHPMCYIDAAGSVIIGNDVSIAHNCSILSTNHDWTDTSVPIKYNPVTFGEVIINDDVWVACGVRILAGITIGQRSIVAAGAVVNKDIEEGTLVGGVPAKVIKRI